MSDELDFAGICEESKKLAGLSAEDEVLLKELGSAIVPALDGVTERFYAVLLSIPRTAAFLDGRVDILKKAHRAWLESLFTQNLDAKYTEWMYHIGAVHVKVNLPVEFMTTGMTLILRELTSLVCAGESMSLERKGKAVAAVGSVCGFSQLVMQKSYDSGKLASELEKFLKITGMSRALFDNLASAYRA